MEASLTIETDYQLQQHLTFCKMKNFQFRKTLNFTMRPPLHYICKFLLQNCIYFYQLQNTSDVLNFLEIKSGNPKDFLGSRELCFICLFQFQFNCEEVKPGIR